MRFLGGLVSSMNHTALELGREKNPGDFCIAVAPKNFSPPKTEMTRDNHLISNRRYIFKWLEFSIVM